jgi:DNA-binding NarL/FixJ family response regulator
MDDRVRVMLVDDNDEFTSNFKEIISLDKRLDYLGRAYSKASGISMTLGFCPDIVVMDLNLSGTALDGIDAARDIRIKTGIKVLLLTAYENEDIVLNASKKAFASGYIFKRQFKNIADIIYQTATSNTVEKTRIKASILKDLTSAEEAVFKGLIEDDVYKYTRASPSTVEKQLASIYKKLDVKCGKDLQRIFGNW